MQSVLRGVCLACCRRQRGGQSSIRAGDVWPLVLRPLLAPVPQVSDHRVARRNRVSAVQRTPAPQPHLRAARGRHLRRRGRHPHPQVRGVHAPPLPGHAGRHALVSGARLLVRRHRHRLCQLSPAALHGAQLPHVLLLPLQAVLAPERDVRGRGHARRSGRHLAAIVTQRCAHKCQRSARCRRGCCCFDKRRRWRVASLCLADTLVVQAEQADALAPAALELADQHGCGGGRGYHLVHSRHGHTGESRRQRRHCQGGDQAVSQVLGAHRQDGRRLVQPHHVQRVRLRVLLALHEGDQRPALPFALGLHVLGQEALVAQEEDHVAAGHAHWGARGHRAHSGRRRALHTHRLAHLVGAQGLLALQAREQAQAQSDGDRHGARRRTRRATRRHARHRHRRAHHARLCVRRGAHIALPQRRLWHHHQQQWRRAAGV